MEFKIYKNKNKPLFVYIHGECLSSFSFKKEVDELKKDYTILLPVLNEQSENHSGFTTIQDAATSIIEYIEQNYDGHVQVLAGFSLGGQIVAEILAKRPDFSEYIMIESVMMKPKKIHSWSDFAAVHLNSLAKNKFFNSFMYYTKFNDDFALEEYYKNYKVMSKETVRNELYATYHYEMPSGLEKVQGKVAILVGQREKKIVKESANLLHEAMPHAQIFVLQNYTHGAFSLGHPQEYIRFVKSWIQEKDKQQRIKERRKKEAEEGQYMPNWKHLLNKMKDKKAHQK